MPPSVPISIRRLAPHDVALMDAMMTTFDEAFGDVETYTKARPSSDYLWRLLDRDDFFALAAQDGETVVGGLVACELPKFEQGRSEIYIYDLAVAAEHRRRGIATALIAELKTIAAARGVYVIFVQAELGDAAAISLYSKLGSRANVLYFDVNVG